MTRVVIVGATSAIAAEYAKQVSVFSQTNFVLIGRNQQKLQLQANDLMVRNPGNSVTVITGNLESSDFVNASLERAFSEGPIDEVLIAQGVLPNQLEVQESSKALANSVLINAISPAMFADAFASKLIHQHQASIIAVFGSVAGDRGRKSNYSYGASKSFVDTFVRGLQHRLSGTNVSVLLIKPGPVDTPMTAHLRGQMPGMASKTLVAREIIAAMRKKKLTLYTPKKWALIMLIIRGIPSKIFNKLNL